MTRKQYPLQARGVPGYVRVLSAENLPDGLCCLTVPCDDYADLKKLPTVLEFEGDLYTRTGWNSDRFIAYYKTGKMATARVWHP